MEEFSGKNNSRNRLLFRNGIKKRKSDIVRLMEERLGDKTCEAGLRAGPYCAGKVLSTKLESITSHRVVVVMVVRVPRSS